MGAFVRTQLRSGVSPTGARVVSVRKEGWRPHIPVPLNPLDGPEIESQGYGMGWIDYTYKGGRFWDGFGAFIGFLPEEDLGLAIIANMSVGFTSFFYKYVLNLLLSETFGIDRGRESCCRLSGCGQIAGRHRGQVGCRRRRRDRSVSRLLPAGLPARVRPGRGAASLCQRRCRSGSGNARRQLCPGNRPVRRDGHPSGARRSRRTGNDVGGL